MEDVLVGEVIRPHGVQGELTIYPITANPARFKKLKEIILAHNGEKRRYTISSARVGSDFVYLRLEGLSDRDLAEDFRGWEVRVDRADVPPLDEGWYYFELEGMQVFEDNRLLGTLVEVLATGANDVYLVRGPLGEICIPALKSVVHSVDVANKHMQVVLPPGLLEDERP